MNHDETAAGGALDMPWPAEHLEAVPRCPVCGSDVRTLRFDELRDLIFHAAPGRWTLWDCGVCGVAYLDPRPDLASIGLAYRTYYTHHVLPPRNVFSSAGGIRLFIKRLHQHAYYNRTFGYALRPAAPGSGFLTGFSALRRARADHRIRHLPAPSGPGRRLLDVGCGEGGFLRVARRLGFEVSGLELDATAGARARETGATIVIGTLEEAGLDPESFDHVTMSHVLEHLHDPVGTLRRILLLLRPGGRVWIQTPNLDSEGLRRFGSDWRGLEPPRHLTLFSPTSLERALGTAGFDHVALLPPQREAEFYFSQSVAAQRGRPVDQTERTLRRQIRTDARRMDRIAFRRPEQGECITMIARRPDA